MKGLAKRLICALVSVASGGILPIRWEWPSRMRVYFNSSRSRQSAISAGLPVEEARVIHSGIDLGKFTFRERSGLEDETPLIPMQTV